MAEVPKKRRTVRQSETSPSLFCLIFLFTLASPASSATWYLNDGGMEGDCFTTAPGSDQSGDGSAAKPFRSLDRALRSAQVNDTLRLDSGDYVLPSAVLSGQGKASVEITIPGLVMEGAGPEKTRLRATGPQGLAFSGIRNLRLTGFSVIGGDASILLDHCETSTLTRVWTRDSKTYGILLKDSGRNKLEDCKTQSSRFRGLQLRRADANRIVGHLSSENANAGICLETSSDNHIEKCQGLKNGMSGFYLPRKSNANVIEKCLAEKNKFVGFYLDIGSVSNRLLDNISSHNERGFTLTGTSDNLLRNNLASSNLTYGFWIKDSSLKNRFEQNKAEGNGNGGFVFAPDSSPFLFLKNLSGSNEAADSLGLPLAMPAQK